MNDNYVLFKGRRDGLVIVLDEKASFDEIKAVLRRKVRNGRKFFGDAKAAIAFSGKELSPEEKTELMAIITDESNMSVSAAEQARQLGGILKAPFSAFNNTTIFHKGSVRSGQVISYPGSVVVIGDVNPGGEIIAEGNIIVLGSLKGLVHAGCGGNIDCFVSAVDLMPAQIRIADVLTYIPNEANKKAKERNKLSAYAYIKEGQIYIAPLS